MLFLPQGKRAAICTDNVTDVSGRDDQSNGAHFVNSVDSFICQSTIIPADGRGFRLAISSQSISLADTFLGKRNGSKWLYNVYSGMSSSSIALIVFRSIGGHHPGREER